MALIFTFFALVLVVINLYLHFGSADDTLSIPIQILVAGILVLAIFQRLSGGGKKKDKENKRDMG